MKPRPYIRQRCNLEEIERLEGIVAERKLEGRSSVMHEHALAVARMLDERQAADEREDKIRAGLGVQGSLL